MKTKLKGGCLCGNITFEIKDDFKTFYKCHCKQCQLLTGSAFASNLLTEPDNITWTSGAEFVATYAHPERDFSKSFCQCCGSALPFVNKSRTTLIVPAGGLNSDITIALEANIFVSEKACWLSEESELKNYDFFPP
jgi:hypothetical protein